ncbi:hypothetical protein IWQ60_000308 [Tieghemiomyces parasiticus]|uniref:Uncharacterized protein n=1 Tax=Tieghemiomyces parasiticus TaxID=78921 RepID=A0A9W8AGE2_9FUNG|nr:hypothetical protein IWQ60_000308 [Tieghemiomyces parasiticus]
MSRFVSHLLGIDQEQNTSATAGSEHECNYESMGSNSQAPRSHRTEETTAHRNDTLDSRPESSDAADQNVPGAFGYSSQSQPAGYSSPSVDSYKLPQGYVEPKPSPVCSPAADGPLNVKSDHRDIQSPRSGEQISDIVGDYASGVGAGPYRASQRQPDNMGAINSGPADMQQATTAAGYAAQNSRRGSLGRPNAKPSRGYDVGDSQQARTAQSQYYEPLPQAMVESQKQPQLQQSQPLQYQIPHGLADNRTDDLDHVGVGHPQTNTAGSPGMGGLSPTANLHRKSSAKKYRQVYQQTTELIGQQGDVIGRAQKTTGIEQGDVHIAKQALSGDAQGAQASLSSKAANQMMHGDAGGAKQSMMAAGAIRTISGGRDRDVAMTNQMGKMGLGGASGAGAVAGVAGAYLHGHKDNPEGADFHHNQTRGADTVGDYASGVNTGPVSGSGNVSAEGGYDSPALYQQDRGEQHGQNPMKLPRSTLGYQEETPRSTDGADCRQFTSRDSDPYLVICDHHQTSHHRAAHEPTEASPLRSGTCVINSRPATTHVNNRTGTPTSAGAPVLGTKGLLHHNQAGSSPQLSSAGGGTSIRHNHHIPSRGSSGFLRQGQRSKSSDSFSVYDDRFSTGHTYGLMGNRGVGTYAEPGREVRPDEEDQVVRMGIGGGRGRRTPRSSSVNRPGADLDPHSTGHRFGIVGGSGLHNDSDDSSITSRGSTGHLYGLQGTGGVRAYEREERRRMKYLSQPRHPSGTAIPDMHPMGAERYNEILAAEAAGRTSPGGRHPPGTTINAQESEYQYQENMARRTSAIPGMIDSEDRQAMSAYKRPVGTTLGGGRPSIGTAYHENWDRDDTHPPGTTLDSHPFPGDREKLDHRFRSNDPTFLTERQALNEGPAVIPNTTAMNQRGGSTGRSGTNAGTSSDTYPPPNATTSTASAPHHPANSPSASQPPPSTGATHTTEAATDQQSLPHHRENQPDRHHSSGRRESDTAAAQAGRANRRKSSGFHRFKERLSDMFHHRSSGGERLHGPATGERQNIKGPNA